MPFTAESQVVLVLSAERFGKVAPVAACRTSLGALKDAAANGELAKVVVRELLKAAERTNGKDFAP